MICYRLKIVSFPVGSLFYKYLLFSYQNLILSYNLYVVSCLFGVHWETVTRWNIQVTRQDPIQITKQWVSVEQGDSLNSAINHTVTFTTICNQQKIILSFY